MLNLLILWSVLVIAPARADTPLPVFDAHLHYNWEPRPHLPLEKVLALFRQNHVAGILATSRPNDGTLALYAARSASLQVIPFIRPYVVRDDIRTWFADPRMFALIEREYQRGIYRGIGEFHLSGQAAAGPLVKKVVEFAAARNLVLHAHADEEALELLFAHRQDSRIIWAHTGFSTSPERVAVYLERYPGLWCELSYRSGITDAEGALTPAWRRLFEKYPGRFLIGSDTWIDERWDRYGDIMAGYRSWLKQLPPAVAERIAWRNAGALFGER